MSTNPRTWDTRVSSMPASSERSLPLLLTVDETAELLRTTRSAIYAMVDRGQLAGVTRIGRRVLIRSDVLMQWLDQKRAPSPDVRTGHSAPSNFSQKNASYKQSGSAPKARFAERPPGDDVMER